MSRLFTAMLSIAFLASAAGGASAKTCRDAHGKFMKCPMAHHMMMTKRCRDKHGKFMKCSMMHKM